VRREVAAELALAVDRLPVLLREAFVLRHLEGLPYPEMAELCGAEVGTLQVRAHRARALLRAQLGSLVDPRWLEEG
jgi:RNA polymerase sigma-70 factor (ECF subfamily)